MQEFNPFVVFGTSKSGTTWLQRLIDTHPEACCHFQVPLFPLEEETRSRLNKKAYAVANFRKDPFAGMIGEDGDNTLYYEQIKFFSKLPEVIKAHARQDGLEYGEYFFKQTYRGIVKEYLTSKAKSSAKVFGTKSYTDLGLLFELYPDAKVINIVRDGRDVVLSKRHHLNNYGVYFHGDEVRNWHYQINKNIFLRRVFLKLLPMFGKLEQDHLANGIANKEAFGIMSDEYLIKAASEWRMINEYFLEWQDKLPDNFLSVRYEDLKTEPSKTVEKICHYLQIDSSQQTIDDLLAANNFNKLKKKSTTFFRKGQVGDWANHFTEHNKRIFKRHTGNMLERLGYVESTEW